MVFMVYLLNQKRLLYYPPGWGLDIKREAIAFNKWSILKGESGQGLSEYALILALIAIACVAAVTAFGTSLSAYFTNITGQIGAL